MSFINTKSWPLQGKHINVINFRPGTATEDCFLENKTRIRNFRESDEAVIFSLISSMFPLNVVGKRSRIVRLPRIGQTDVLHKIMQSWAKYCNDCINAIQCNEGQCSVVHCSAEASAINPIKYWRSLFKSNFFISFFLVFVTRHQKA